MRRIRYSKVRVGGLPSYAMMEFYIFCDVKAEMFDDPIKRFINMMESDEIYASKRSTLLSNEYR